MDYQPTYGILETARNIKAFCKRNFGHFMQLLKPLMLPLAVLSLVESGVSLLKENPVIMTAGVLAVALTQSYIYALLAVAWHRFVILGPQAAEKVEIFSPQKRDWAFIGYYVLMFLICMVAGAAFGAAIGFGLGKGHEAAMTVLTIALALVALFVWLRWSIVLPSIAVDRGLGLAGAYRASRGLALKLFMAPFLANLVPLLLTVLYLVVTVTLAMFVSRIVSGTFVLTEYAGVFAVYVLKLPITLFVTPWLMVRAVTGLSNYYMWAAGQKS